MSGSCSLLEQVLSAHGPLASTGALIEHLSAGGLLRGGCLARQTRAANRLPCGNRELVQSVVQPVAGDDRGAATRRTLGQGAPVQGISRALSLLGGRATA